MRISKGDNVAFNPHNGEFLGEVKQVIRPSNADVKVAIICYEDTDGKKQIRKSMDELAKPLDRQDEDPCPQE